MVVFDTEVLLSFYFGEEGSEVVEEVLSRISMGTEIGLINIVNLTELWYVLARKDPQIADRRVDALRSYGVKIVPVEDDSLWRIAAEIKSNKSIPLADTFAAATARLYGETLLAGRDEHFDDLNIDVRHIM